MAAEAGDMILKYTASAYEEKINSIENYKTRLEGHLKTLENLRAEVENYFTGEEAAEFWKNLSDQIRVVKEQHENCETLRAKYEDTKGDLDRASTAINTANANAKQVIDTKLNVLKAIGDFIPG